MYEYVHRLTFLRVCYIAAIVRRTFGQRLRRAGLVALVKVQGVASGNRPTFLRAEWSIKCVRAVEELCRLFHLFVVTGVATVFVVVVDDLQYRRITLGSCILVSIGAKPQRSQ